MQIVDYKESSVLQAAPGVEFDESGDLMAGIVWDGTAWLSPISSHLVVGPFNLQVGDLVNVVLQHEFTNGIRGMNYPSQTGSALVMGATGVKRGALSSRPDGGAWVMRQHEQNWDSQTYHLTFDRSVWHRITSAGSHYFWDRIYFKGFYINPSDANEVRIESRYYPMLQVAQFR